MFTTKTDIDNTTEIFTQNGAISYGLTDSYQMEIEEYNSDEFYMQADTYDEKAEMELIENNFSAWTDTIEFTPRKKAVATPSVSESITRFVTAEKEREELARDNERAELFQAMNRDHLDYKIALLGSYYLHN
jgi:hypothetical protein